MPEVKIHSIKNLKVSTAQTTDKDGMTKDVCRLSFEADIHPGQLARILNYQRQRQLIDIWVEAPQVEMDLALTPVNTKTGEIVEG